MNVYADLLIIGAGPAGLSAALAAAPSGARIVMLDDNPLAGGQIWRDGPQANVPGQARRLRERLASCNNIRHHAGTRVIAAPGAKQLLVEDDDHGWLISYDKLILCTGARELLLPFPGWTLPGVTGAGGLQALIKAGVPVQNERVVIAGSGPLLLASAATAKQHGALGRLYEDIGQRRWVAFKTYPLRDFMRLAEKLGVPVVTTPDAKGCFPMDHSELALVEGAIAGHAAVGNLEAARQLWPRRARWQGFAKALNSAFALDPRLKSLAQPDTLVCRCEDVPYAALTGHSDWREAKLASRCGMGACQGRVCGGAVQHLFGWQPSAPRPPFSPARIETLMSLDDTPPA
ncbi:MAG: FAD-dependent oxidoreductase [Pseudomonas fluorescens]|nr:FAD-dependent oxidoreductase [Pseudomonas fluorescens]